MSCGICDESREKNNGKTERPESKRESDREGLFMALEGVWTLPWKSMNHCGALSKVMLWSNLIY